MATEESKSILAVEDNFETQVLIRHMLKKHYAIETASDGDTALNKIQEQEFDLILMDINLGRGKTGEEVLQAARKIDNGKSVPVIALTAYALQGDRERFLEKGFDNYLSKPFTKEQLMLVVGKYLPLPSESA